MREKLNQLDSNLLKIVEYKEAGRGSRWIANQIGLCKSTVNNLYKKYRKLYPSTTEQNKPKICIIDVETSAAKVYCFGRYNQNFGEDNIYEEGGKILCVSWKWVGEDKIHSLHMTPKQIRLGYDLEIVNALYELYEQADAVVMHNAKKFDHKVIQTRVLYWLGLELPTVKVIDTLQIAKSKLRLPSNKLDSIGEYFGLGRKQKTEGIRLWADVQEGSVQAMKKMVEYCKQDVNLLDSVYHLLKGLGTANSGFNANNYFTSSIPRCKECSSLNIKKTNRNVFTLKGKYSEYKCVSCGGVFRDTYNQLSKEKRDSILV